MSWPSEGKLWVDFWQKKLIFEQKKSFFKNFSAPKYGGHTYEGGIRMRGAIRMRGGHTYEGQWVEALREIWIGELNNVGKKMQRAVFCPFVLFRLVLKSTKG